jgi:Fur family ferric uptake transcriptional regulator
LVLGNFLNYDFAISQGFLEQQLPEDFDRVTIYRTLKTFFDSGLIHKILDDEGGVKYALCKEDCSMERHNHSHVHFKCEVCGKTICMDSVAVPDLHLPDNFTVKEINLLASGVCENCK